MIYLDSSALLKLVLVERETQALADWLTVRRGEVVVSSELARVEVMRACWRIESGGVIDARALLSGMDLIPMADAVLDRAAHLDGEALRSLDAIHLASALAIHADISTFCVYDARLAQAAVREGLPVESPGVRA